MQVGQACPEGFLPVYSCDNEKDAKLLVVMCCPKGYDGKYYARELVGPHGVPLEGKDRIDAFVRFGKNLEAAHKRLIENRRSP